MSMAALVMLGACVFACGALGGVLVTRFELRCLLREKARSGLRLAYGGKLYVILETSSWTLPQIPIPGLFTSADAADRDKHAP